MGMDVFGKSPTAENGKYFRNSVWWWHPLADYITSAHPEIASACTEWHSNSGDGLGADGARALAQALNHDLDSGAVALYEAERQAEIEALPRETCRLCAGTGTRSDAVGVELGFAAQGWCNGCDGVGDCEPWPASYVFDVQNVAGFAQFAEASGGFEIW